MESLYLLIPISLVIVAIAAWLFLRMSSSGQFDDLESPAYSVLLDDDKPPENPTTGTPAPDSGK
jgi:cbb3-type cytochrome oxidase maturation protein